MLLNTVFFSLHCFLFKSDLTAKNTTVTYMKIFLFRIQFFSENKISVVMFDFCWKKCALSAFIVLMDNMQVYCTRIWLKFVWVNRMRIHRLFIWRIRNKFTTFLFDWYNVSLLYVYSMDGMWMNLLYDAINTCNDKCS